MIMGALLLIGIWALLVGILAALHICDDPMPPPAMATVSRSNAVNTHQAVMTLWYQTRLHLDALERTGADVATARQNLTHTVEMLLSSQLLHQGPDFNEPGPQALTDKGTPAVVDRFGSLRIYG